MSIWPEDDYDTPLGDIRDALFRIEKLLVGLLKVANAQL